MSYEIELAQKIWELDQEKTKLSKELDSVKAEYNKACEEMIEYLTEEGKASTGKIDGVGLMSLKREIYPGVNKCSLPGFIDWLKTSGAGSLVQETVPAGTLKTYLKDLKEELVAKLEEVSPADFSPVVQLYGAKQTNLFYAFRNELEKKTTQKGCALEPEEIAAVALEQLGCSVFQNIKLSHTQKGK